MPMPLPLPLFPRTTVFRSSLNSPSMQMREMLSLILHVCICLAPLCEYPNCRKIKVLFWHGLICKTTASGGCVLCRRVWFIFQLHARLCENSESCHVPCCRDMKESLRRRRAESNSR